MADIVRDILDNSTRQRKVIFQQRKPLLNYELNLAQDILKEGLEEFTRVSIGDNFSGESFQVDPGLLTNEVFIRKGTFYHKGVPISMTADKRMFISPPPSTGTRFDVVYATWKIEQSDSTPDPVIGFSTTQEQKVVLEIIYESNTRFPTSITPETIQFNANDKSITLTKGEYPDWLRVAGTRFKTNAIDNTENTYLTVLSSLSNKTIFVDEYLTDQTYSDVRFTQYMSSGEIPKEYRAFRENVIILAVLERVAGDFNINKEYIHDKRPAMANNFVVKGCAPYRNGTHTALEVGISSGEFFVGGDKEFLEDNTLFKVTVYDNSLNYIYITSIGALSTGTSVPNDFHVMLAEVQAKNGVITDIRDVRKFRPSSFSGGESQGTGETLTGFNTISHNFTAGEDLDAFDIVYLDSDAKVRRATASDRNKLPVIGVATQATASGQENTFITFGIVSIPKQNGTWVAGDDVFIDAASGKLTNSIGVSSLANNQYVQRVGVAVSSKEIFFKPDLSYIKNDTSSEINLLTLRDTGEIEVMGAGDKISPDRLNFLASTKLTPISQGIEILSGRYFVNGNLAKHFEGQVINMGTGGTDYKTKAITPGYYNKAFFTLDRDGVVRMYEGVAEFSIPTIDPAIPDSELPLCVVTFKDSGSGSAGSILNISESDITDKRPWLNMGSVEDSAFQAIFNSPSSVLVQRGEAWFSKKYINLTSNTIINVSTSPEDYYFYLNISSLVPTEPNLNHTVNASHFVALTLPPTQVHRRDYILLATYTVTSLGINRSTFKTFKSKFWDFQDIPFFGEQVWRIGSVHVAGTPFKTNDIVGNVGGLDATFQFTNTDFLEVMINGMPVFEGDDYTKTGLDGAIVSDQNGIKFLYDIPAGAEIRIRKI